MKLLKTIGCAAAVLLLAASANAATTLIPGVFKREMWFGAVTRAQVEAGTQVPTVATNVVYWDTWDLPDTSDNYIARASGVVIPDTTQTYDFYLAADDDTDLFLSTDDQPANKRMISSEPSWTGRRAWKTAGQQNSVTFTNAAGATPFASGISLVAGTRYYLEAVQHEGGGGDNFAVTMVPHNSAVLSGDATTLTGSLIGYVITTPTTLSFTKNPSNTTAYVGTSARFSVATSTDSSIPPRYQWRRNGTDIPNATSANYTIVASSGDTSAQFDCVAVVPGFGPASITRTSLVATLTVPAAGALTVTGRLKREVFASMTQTTNGGVRLAVESGSVGKGTVSAVDTFVVPSAGANYGERVNGFFTPAVSGRYVFFVSADDDTDLFVSTSDQPSAKQLVAQETVWSENLKWQSSGGGSILGQKRSDFWLDPVSGLSPYSGGILMTAGTRYYIEAVHRSGGGGNNVSSTFALTNDVDIALLTPADGTASAFTNGVISYVTTPVTTFSISQQPANTSVFEGLSYKFTVGVTTDSEVSPSYQWKRNGTNIVGATGNSYSGTAALSDSGATFSVDLTIPGVTNATSATATLTVQQSVFASGSLKVERWNGTVLTRAIIGANAPGTVPEADSVKYINSGFDYVDSGSDYVLRLSGFFVPATTGNYVFLLAADDDTDLYLGTNDKADTKRLIAQESGWSGNKNWNTIGGGSTLPQRRSDQWSPDAGATVPYAAGIPLTAGTRYYIEAVNHQGGGGQNLAATFIKVGDPDPANGSATALVGARVGVLVPAATSLTILTNPQSVSTYGWQSVVFSASATNNGLLPTAYQWRKGGVAISNATATSYGFITSSNDGGQFDCVVSVPGTSLAQTSTVATLTISAGATFVSGSLQRERWDGNGVNRPIVNAGSAGVANIQNTVTNIDQTANDGDNYAQRIRGIFVAPLTTNYVFFICSDDDSDLFLSTDDQPKNKRLIAHENSWSNPRNWVSAGSGGDVAVTQKRSDKWSPDGGVTVPFSAGIPLIAGNKYYIEAVQAEGGGGDNLGVTYKIQDPIDPALGDPVTDDPSILTGTVIGSYVAPGGGGGKVITAVKSGSTLNVSWTPTGGRLVSSGVLTLPSTSWPTLGTANPTTLTIGSTNLFLQVIDP